MHCDLQFTCVFDTATGVLHTDDTFNLGQGTLYLDDKKL